MNREIKFTGKRTDTGEWAYGDIIHGVGAKKDRLFILPIEQFYRSDCNNLDGYEVIPESVGEYINRKDKNDKEIYEGHIVDISLFDEGDMYRVIIENIKHVPDELRGSSFNWCEVMGNILDNPELIK